MPLEPIKVDFPFAGVHQGVAYEQQPPNTSQRIVNMRPRDWSVGGRRRGAVRPGLDLYCPVRVGGGGPIRAMAPLPGSTAVLVDDEVLWFDDFNLPATTTPGTDAALGDRNGNGTPDYKVFLTGLSKFGPSLAARAGSDKFFVPEALDDIIAEGNTGTTTVTAIRDIVVVGLPGWNTAGGSGSNNAGRVRIYQREGGGLSLRAEFFPTGVNVTGANLGAQLSIDYLTSDPNIITVVAAASNQSTTGIGQRGQLYVYRSTDGGASWSQLKILTGGNYQNQRLGRLFLDYDADADWIVASREQDGSNQAGIQVMRANSTAQHHIVQSIGLNSIVAVRGNYIAWARPTSNPGTRIYKWDGAVWGSPTQLQDTIGVDLGNLGTRGGYWAFTRDGERLLLGLPGFGTDDGGIFVYKQSAGTFDPQAAQLINAPGTGLGQQFGRSLAAWDGRAVALQFIQGQGPNINVASGLELVILDYSGGSYSDGQVIRSAYRADSAQFGSRFFGMSGDDEINVANFFGQPSSVNRGIERWVGVDMTGAAPYVQVTGGEGRLQDLLRGPAGWACLWADRGSPDPLDANADGDYDNDRLILSIRCRTAPTLVGRAGVVGIFAYGDENSIDAADGSDRASVFTIAKQGDGFAMNARGWVNNASQMDGFVQQANLNWQPNREYTFRLILDGFNALLEVETDNTTTLLATCPNIRLAGGDHVAAGRVATGFIFGSSSLNDADEPLFAWVDDFRIATGSSQTQNFNTRTIAVGGTDLAVASSEGSTILSGGVGAVSMNQTAWLLYVPPLDQGQEGRVLIYDGLSYRQVDATSLTLTDRTASAGELPGTGTGENDKCRYAVVWQNSVMSWGRDTFPTNWYLSRVADPDNHLYIVPNPDGLQAAAGDNTRIGLLPGPITCMIPATADVLIAATRESLFAFIGRPTLGGYLDDVSDLVGIVGPRAAARDDVGNLYFFSLRGLYIMPAGSRVAEKLSRGRMDTWTDSIDHSAEEIIVRWSEAEEGVHIYRVPKHGGAVEHVFWDRQENAFVFDVYPEDYNPCASILSVDSAGRPRILVGGRDGFIRSLVPGVFDDNGHPIEAEAYYPPIIGGSRRAILGAMSLRLGQDTDKAAWEIRAASGGESLVGAPLRYSGVASAHRMNHIHRRVGGPVVGVSLRNIDGSRLSVEDLLLHIESGGLVGRDGQ